MISKSDLYQNMSQIMIQPKNLLMAHYPCIIKDQDYYQKKGEHLLEIYTKLYNHGINCKYTDFKHTDDPRIRVNLNLKQVNDYLQPEIIKSVIFDELPNIFRLKNIYIEKLLTDFTKAKNKNAAVQSLKDKIEKQLKQMVERNPLLVDYYQRYQEIIEAYNHGKDEVVIQDTFRKLIELINSLTEEEAETKREGLSDEQKAIFDILRQGKELEKEEKAKIKKLSVELLEELKKEKLQVEQVWDKAPTSAAVYNYVNKTLFEDLPYPTYQNDDIDLMTNLVYEHLKNQYYGGGNSVYGKY